VVSRSTVDRPLAAGHRLEVEIQARDYDGRLLGTLFRGEAPPTFVGLVRQMCVPATSGGAAGRANDSPRGESR
jgi:hypothetical protein